MALITQPIYSIHLSADEFGIIGYFNAIKNVFTPLFILGMTSVYLMHYFKQNEEDNKKMLFNIIFYLCLFNTGFLVISYAGLYAYFSLLEVNIPLNPFGWFILVTLVLDNIKSIVLINFRVGKKAFSFFSFSAVYSVLNVILGLLFVAVLKWGAEGRMLAPIISAVLMLPAAIYILKRYTTINFNYNAFKKSAKLAMPLVLAAYAFVPISNIDSFYLERLDNIAELGLYNIGITIAGYAQLAYTAIALALEPDIFKSIAEKKINNLRRVALLMFVPYLIF
ncbi:MAG: oligosaccharide flippase family protein [Ignavibacteriales bacterium]|nr:oligosaccharide flippase family protein [Ignavibacteriales bacterium]